MESRDQQISDVIIDKITNKMLKRSSIKFKAENKDIIKVLVSTILDLECRLSAIEASLGEMSSNSNERLKKNLVRIRKELPKNSLSHLVEWELEDQFLS